MRKPWLVLLIALTLFAPGTTLAQNDRSELIGLTETMLTQLDLAVQQSAFGAFSATLAEVRLNARQTLNIMVGRDDPGFDSNVPNLGDGVGLLNHINRLSRALSALTPARELRITADNMRFFAGAAVDLLKGALEIEQAERARRQVRLAQGLLLAARGAPDDLPSEGGARTLLSFLRRAGD